VIASLIARRLPPEDPENTLWQRDVSLSLDRIGDILVSGGDRDGALKAYQESRMIGLVLVRIDPGNAQWQHLEIDQCPQRRALRRIAPRQQQRASFNFQHGDHRKKQTARIDCIRTRHHVRVGAVAPSQFG